MGTSTFFIACNLNTPTNSPPKQDNTAFGLLLKQHSPSSAIKQDTEKIFLFQAGDTLLPYHLTFRLAGDLSRRNSLGFFLDMTDSAMYETLQFNQSIPNADTFVLPDTINGHIVFNDLCFTALPQENGVEAWINKHFFYQKIEQKDFTRVMDFVREPYAKKKVQQPKFSQYHTTAYIDTLIQNAKIEPTLAEKHLTKLYRAYYIDELYKVASFIKKNQNLRPIFVYIHDNGTYIYIALLSGSSRFFERARYHKAEPYYHLNIKYIQYPAAFARSLITK